MSESLENLVCNPLIADAELYALAPTANLSDMIAERLQPAAEAEE